MSDAATHRVAMGPVPMGLTADQWARVFNSADSARYNYHNKNSNLSKADRISGVTRQHALARLSVDAQGIHHVMPLIRARRANAGGPSASATTGVNAASTANPTGPSASGPSHVMPLAAPAVDLGGPSADPMIGIIAASSDAANINQNIADEMANPTEIASDSNSGPNQQGEVENPTPAPDNWEAFQRWWALQPDLPQDEETAAIADEELAQYFDFAAYYQEEEGQAGPSQGQENLQENEQFDPTIFNFANTSAASGQDIFASEESNNIPSASDLKSAEQSDYDRRLSLWERQFPQLAEKMGHSKRSAAGGKKTTSGGDSSSDDELYCYCRGPDDHTPMVCCENCDLWCHARCVNLSPSDVKRLKCFYCRDCTDESKGRVTVLKDVCFLLDCNQILTDERPFNRFCSQAHVNEWAMYNVETYFRQDSDPSHGTNLNINEADILFGGVDNVSDLRIMGKEPTLNLDRYLYAPTGLSKAENESHVTKLIDLAEIRRRTELIRAGVKLEEIILAHSSPVVGPHIDIKGKGKEVETERQLPKVFEIFDYDTLLNDEEIIELQRLRDKQAKRAAFLEIQKFRRGLLRPIIARNKELSEALGIDGMCGSEGRFFCMTDEELIAFKESSEGEQYLATNKLTLRPIDKGNLELSEDGTTLMPEHICIRKKCAKHKGWGRLPIDEYQMVTENAADETKSDDKKISEMYRLAEIRAVRES